MRTIKEKAVRALRWSERYTKTDMVYLATGGSLLSLGQFASAFAALLLSIVFANLLPPEIFGTYKYILSVASILAIPTLQGINTAVTQAIAKGHEGAYDKALPMKLRWGALSSLGSMIVAGYYFANGDHTLAASFLIVAVFLPFLESFGIYSALLNGKKVFGTLTVCTIIAQGLSLISLAGALLATDNIHTILLAYFIPLTAAHAAFFFVTRRRYRTNDVVDPGMLSYGKHLSLMGAVTTFANYFDRIILFQLLGTVPLASYVIAGAPISQMKGLFSHIKTLSVPQFAGKDLAHIRHDYWRKFGVLFLVLAGATLLYIVVAPFIFNIIFPLYADSVIYSQLLALSLVSYVSIINISLLQAKRAQKELYRQAFLAPAVRIVLLLVGVVCWGLFGLIIAHLTARYWYALYSTWHVYRLMRAPQQNS